MQTTEIKLNQVLCGKSEERLKEFPDNFFDGTVTDPPYEMDFMGKQWDSTGIAFSVELWKEVLRVAKPGSFLFCFGGTRTYHRVTCAIEDAGWIIRDQMVWVHGEGFPKSTNISKQLDKEVGAERTEVIGKYISPDGCERNRKNCKTNNWIPGGTTNHGQEILAPVTNDAKRWDGYGTGLKPGWEPIIVAMKPLEKGLTYAQNAKKWGVAGLNIDGGRIAARQGEYDIRHYTKEDCFVNDKPKESQFQVKPQPQGRWPSNVILSHSPDCVCVGTKIINEGEKRDIRPDKEYQVKGFIKNIKANAPYHYGQETVEVWACVPDCPIRIMDGQSGHLHAPISNGSSKGAMFDFNAPKNRPSYTDSGGASRFFYCAKAKRSEKEAGLIGFAECMKCGKFNSKEHTIIVDGVKKKEKCIRNNHPTVKPLDLMRYLINLIKMPLVEENKQVILDPFCGSGTTLVAAEQLGINYIGIDMDSDSCLTAIGRIGVE